MLQLVLMSESTIGSSQIDAAKDCAKAFPVMDDIAAWRLYEGGTIGFANAARKPRIRLPTQDNHDVVEAETDGIFTIVKKQDLQVRRSRCRTNFGGRMIRYHCAGRSTMASCQA
jgi:hypothetical protein